MDAATSNRFRQQLLAEKARLEELVRSLNEDGLGESLFETTQELSRYDNHPGDLGSEVFERSKDLALRDNLQIQLQKINDALASISKGTYGYCQDCGREISLERLEAVPETTLCLECRQKREQREERDSRPIEEKVILPPFGGQTFEPGEIQSDEEEAIQYDGEDVWQELGQTLEHASESRSGSYYGPLDLSEDQGNVESVEEIAYYKGADGMFYEDTGAYIADESSPAETEVGQAGWDRVDNSGKAGQ